MNLRTVWQRLTRRPRTPPRGQPSAPPAAPGDPAAAPTPDPLGKQRRGYQDKAIHPGDYDDKESAERIRDAQAVLRYMAGDRIGISLEAFAEKYDLKACRA